MNTESIDKRFAPVHSSRTFNRILDTLNLRTKKTLDLGCGYGEYLVEFGKNSVGITTTLAEIEYGKQKNLRILRGNVEFIDEIGLKESFEAIWANNLFEHLLSPHSFLIKLKTIAQPETILILGVPTVPRLTSIMHLGRFRGALAGAHVNFFTRETLRLTVERAGWKVEAARSFYFGNVFLDWLFSFFAPHIYIVAKNNMDFRYPDKKLSEWKDEAHYQKLISIVNK
jgi:SAM-dependent methyltransferase